MGNLGVSLVVYTKVNDKGVETIEAIKDGKTDQEINIDKNGEYLGASPTKDGIVFLMKSANKFELEIFSSK